MTVTISFASPVLTNHKAGVSSYKVYHVVNGVLQDTNAQVGVNADGSVSSVTFTTPSFSPFAIVADPAQYSAILQQESESTAASESESTAASESESTAAAESEAESTRVAESEAESTRVAESEAESTRVAESEAESTRVAESESESERIAEYEDESQKESESESERLSAETERETETEPEKRNGLVGVRKVGRRNGPQAGTTISLQDICSSITVKSSTAETQTGVNRSATIDFSMDYVIKPGQIDTAKSKETWIYDISSLVGTDKEKTFSSLTEVTDGAVKDESGNWVGSYSIHDGKIFIKIDEKFWKDPVTRQEKDSNCKGFLNFSGQLNEEHNYNKKDETIEFPGTAGVPITYEEKTLTSTKGVAWQKEANGNSYYQLPV